MVLHDDKFVEIKWDEVNRIIISTWKGYMSSEQYRAAVDKLFEFTNKYKATKFIYDMRNFMTLRPEDQEWTMTIQANRVFKAVGKTKSALVMPGNMIQKQVLDKLVSSDKVGNQTFIAATVEEGIVWLKK